MSKCCSLCGQEIPERREGVLLSPLKTRLFDAIKRAGRDGIAGDDLFDLFLKERGAQYTVLKTHVCQINDKLAGTDCMIAVTRMGGNHGIYRLKRTEAAE